MKVTLTLAAALFLSAPFAFGQGGPKTSDVGIQSISVAGSGCKPGTYEALVTNTIPGGVADMFQVTFDELDVESGPGTTIKDARAHCEMTVKLKFPEGYRLVLKEIEYDGYAEFPSKKIYGEVETNVELVAEKNGKIIKSRFSAPHQSDYKIKDDLGALKSLCYPSAVIDVITDLRIKGDIENVRGVLTQDTSSGTFTQGLKVEWEKCD